MPQTCSSFSPALGIRLQSDQPSYSPGDTIIGYVYRKAPTVSPDSSVTIALCGRAKSRMVVSTTNRNTTYRGRFALIPERNCAQKIFHGPLHIESGSDEQVWPFAITLPQYVDPTHLQGERQVESYLSLGAMDHILPSTFVHDSSKSAEAFVEYFLKATMVLTGQGHVERPEATLPFVLQRWSPGPPRADFGLKESKNRQSVSTYRLIPGMEVAKLSFSQKMKKSFGTSSVPTFLFDVFVDVPTIIQLDNPNPIPFKIRIVPERKATSEAIKDIPEQVKLLSVSIRIISTTNILCEGSIAPHEAVKKDEIDLCIMTALGKLAGDIYIPCADDSSPIDIGELIDLRLGHSSPGFPQRYSAEDVRFTHSFTTYNIRNSHKLSWTIKGEIAGEYFGVSGAVALKLLMPSDDRGALDQKDSIVKDGKGSITRDDSDLGNEAGPSRLQHNESWIQPPDEDDAPPSFNEVVRDDEKLHTAEKDKSEKGGN
ncbi:Ff.00g035800.m01.CDS01 [Fusarium sp. VM40]|nr:Ff.00g035800.m01.CDS01 [Fusarium sp. VM40]